jgi:hypothetical protein
MGKLIKRYVIEYANDCFTLLKKGNRTEDMQKISRIVNYCERGYMTNMEAVRAITEIVNG